MKKALFKNLKYVTAAAITIALLPTVALAERYKVTSIAPGMSPFVVNTAIAKVVNNNLDDVELQVRATGAATKHMVDAANGQVDFLFGSPTINWLMANQIGPFKDFADAPELEKKVGMIFSYQIGPYHYVTRADSGIETLNDLRGKKIFAGPPGGAATGVVLRAIEQSTGIKKEEMDVQAFGFDAAIQAFQDDKIDVIVLPTNVPSPAIQQFSLTKDIRILNVEVDKVKVNAATGGTINEIAADAYGDNQKNEQATKTHGAIVNFSAGLHVSDDVVYEVTKTIWENIAEIQETAEWMPSTINKESGLALIAGRLHPGAARYYKEAGWEIPEPTVFMAK